MRTIYKSSEVEKDSYSLKWPPTPSKVYINLVCIDRTKVGQRNEYDEVTKVMVEHGDVDVVHGKKWPIDFNEMASGIPDIGLEQVVLVEGAPGVGKSTFAWEYCRRWERGEIAQQYQLVLLLRLRDERMSKAKTLRDLIYHPSENVSEAVFTDLVSSMGANAMIILEGFDELPDACRNSQSIFMQLISNKLLPSATVMVTSRPWATKKVLKDYKHRMYQHIEILGFTTQQISKYIHSVLSESEAKDLESYVKNHPQIKGCMYIPLNSAIVVTVYQESQSSGCPMPKTLTELYTALAKTLLVRYQNGHSEIEKSNKEHTIGIFNERFPYTIKNNFNKLCKLAYSGIVREGDEVQLIFKESDLPADFDNLGFMDSVTELYVTRGTVSSHNFLHLTFQEFFAAVHISTMSPAEQLQHFQRHKDGKLNVVLEFLAGVSQLSCLSAENVPHALLKPLDHENNSTYGVKCEVIMDSTLVNWIFEAQTDTVFDMLLRNRSIKYYTGWSIQPMDYYALGYCIAHSQSQWFLGMNTLHAETVELLVAGISLVPNFRRKVVGMDIPVTKGAAKVFDGLKDMFDLHQLSLGLPLEVIDIHWLDLSSLQVLTLNMCPKNPWQLEALIPLHLKSLTLTLPDEDNIDNVLLLEDCIALEKFIATTTTLKEFIIEEFLITEEKMEIITCALATNESLSMERLEFNSECDFNDSVAEYMTLFVAKTSSTLKYLYYEGPLLTEFT